MRLSKIKLSGFKSFVDPTTIHFPSPRVGIVGPNGCGKSNVIDAVRWVMGEASAKHLRGESMADVIFNGSNTRKPVGKASVELVFDNSDGKAGGQYANYAEIAVRREVSRDGTSSYFLNGTRCRRRDITDIFLGTGLGPRSYAIIEQGMISRLIEAKPEELRVFFEEAAGISKYKERRRETENRIRHTRENLDRLNDLREEVDKQLEVLQRQARTAERYKEMAADARRLKAELLALRWRDIDSGLTDKDRAIGERENALQAAIAELRHIEAEIEQTREKHAEAQEAFNAVQARFYQIGADIARLEQDIQHGRELKSRQEKDLAEARHSLDEIRGHLERDQIHLEDLGRSLAELEPGLERAREAEKGSAEVLAEAEEAMQRWQQEWEDFNQSAGETTRGADVERTRIDHLDRQLQQALTRHERMGEERGSLSPDAIENELKQFEEQSQQAGARRDEQQAQLDRVVDDLRAKREQDKELTHSLHEHRSALENGRGRLSSLEALQQAALGKSRNVVNDWLGEHGLADLPRLAEQLNVSEGWERAVETVLGFHLQAVCVEELDGAASQLAALSEGRVALMEAASGADAPSAGGRSLSEQVNSPLPVGGLLHGVRTADNVDEALAQRHTLGEGESLITRDGIWLGRHWARVHRAEDGEAGVLAREQEIRQLKEELAEHERRVAEQSEAQEALRAEIREFEERREALQTEVNKAHREQADLQGQVNARRSRLEQVQRRLENLNNESHELEQHIEQAEADLKAARARLQESMDRMGELEDERRSRTETRDALRERLEQARTKAREDRDAAHELAVRVEGRRSQRDSLEQGMTRMRQQQETLGQRVTELERSLEEGVEPLENKQRELTELLDKRRNVEAELGEARRHSEELDAHMRELDQQRHKSEERSGEVRTELEALRLNSQEMRTRRQTLAEQLGEMDASPEAVFNEMPADASVEAWQGNLEAVEQRIARLGNINMAAIDQFQEQTERKQYLDTQNDDLLQALETLENAIHKIDRETRTRFRETFDKVNAGLQSNFPRLFGGGHAYLELTGEDLLDAGVAVMARPPGKRNSSIHLLSGGEKALTAVALVFSIFELNPAPFCMLDEVDAPLDDANVGRFCDLVREMSERVQFIFITHNKVTMELSEQLTGVTMHEPGVSRLVAVDVEEAAQMAAM